MKTLLRHTLSLVLVLLTSMSAWAISVEVAGESRTSSGYFVGSEIISGTVYLDVDAKKLTLTNAVIEGRLSIRNFDEFSIELVGKNTVTIQDDYVLYISPNQSCQLTIEGTGSLIGTTNSTSGIYYNGYNAGTLTIKDCTLDITSKQTAFLCTEDGSSNPPACDLVINNATVYAQVKDHSDGYGAITCFKSITLTDCAARYPSETRIYAKNGYSYGFWDDNTGTNVTRSLMIIPDTKYVAHNITTTAINGSVSTDVSSAKAGDLVTVTATPNSGYVLGNVTVTDTEGNDIDCPITLTNVASWKNTTATFLMPPNAVTVTPLFTNELTAANGLYVLMPKTGSTTINASDLSGVTSFKVYDDGGKDGLYSHESEGTLVIQAPSGKILQLEGMVICETDYDYAVFYQGTSTSDPILGENKYSFADGVDVGTLMAGQNLTIYFDSDRSVCYDGLDLTVSVLTPVAHSITVNSAAGGSVVASTYSAIPGDIVTLTATPNSGYVLTGYTINGGDVANNGAWYSSTATFSMPNEDVTVTPVFSNDLSNMFINIPKDGGVATTDVLPFTNAGISHFKIYDDGGEGTGADQHSARFSTGTLVLNAPTGKRVAISGRVWSTSDQFSIYDGDSNASPLLYNPSPKNRAIGLPSDVFVSSGESLTLVLTTESDYADLDFTAWYVSPSEEFNVLGLGATTGGTVSASKTSARAGETITLTCTPSTGYKLAHLNVYDSDGRAQKINGGWFTQTTATFKMPGCAATVEAVFTNNLTAAGGLFIPLQRTGTVTVTADQMEGVSSFRIYGDGGYNEIDTTRIDSKLDITIAAGKVFSVQGRISSGKNEFYTNEEADENLVVTMHSSDVAETDIPSNHMVMTCYVSDYERNQFLDVIVNVKTAVPHTITMLTAAGGTATVQATAINNEVVTITATPNTGYKLVEFIVDGGAVPVTEGGFYNPVGTFNMPDHDITIQPVFTNNLTAAGGLYVNLKNGTININPEQLEGVTSFKVYDNGGSTGVYSNQMDCYLKITAPHHTIQVTGTVTTEEPAGSVYDYLTVYDGLDETTYLGEEQYSGKDGVNIGTLTSTFKRLMLYFHADSSNTDDGLDLTVNLLGYTTYSITINQTAGGTISAPSSAYPEDEVPVTITPETGKVLTTLTINGTPVTIDFGTGSTTFTMPAENVTLVPTFSAGEVGIKIPSSGTKKINVPEGITEFSVKDANGDDNYENNWSGYLTITVPVGCTMNIEGTCFTEGTGWDWLTIYDGADNNAAVLGENKYGNPSGTYTEVTGLTTTSNVVTFWFKSDSSNTGAGPDLTITVNAPVAGDGDVDDDGDLDIDDVEIIADMIVGKTSKTNAADLNGDAKVDVADLTKAVNNILGR